MISKKDNPRVGSTDLWSDILSSPEMSSDALSSMLAYGAATQLDIQIAGTIRIMFGLGKALSARQAFWLGYLHSRMPASSERFNNLISILRAAYQAAFEKKDEGELDVLAPESTLSVVRRTVINFGVDSASGVVTSEYERVK